MVGKKLSGKWLPVLGPGISGAAGHGVIRAAHAVRILASAITELRKAELADALAYWACRFLKLPGRAAAAAGSLTPMEALRQLHILPAEKRARFGLVSRKLEKLNGFPPFSNAINMIGTSGAVSAQISALTQAFCSVYLANAKDAKSCIAFIHCVTIFDALRPLVPLVTNEDALLIIRYAWQAAAGLYAVLGERPGDYHYMEIKTGCREIIDTAVDTGDEHAIKFTAACLGEFRLNPEPVYLASTLDATSRLGEIAKFIGKES